MSERIRIRFYRQRSIFRPRKWRWTAKGMNGEPLGDSGQGYVELDDAKRGLELIRNGAIVDMTVDES